MKKKYPTKWEAKSVFDEGNKTIVHWERYIEEFVFQETYTIIKYRKKDIIIL